MKMRFLPPVLIHPFTVLLDWKRQHLCLDHQVINYVCTSVCICVNVRVSVGVHKYTQHGYMAIYPCSTHVFALYVVYIKIA